MYVRTDRRSYGHQEFLGVNFLLGQESHSSVFKGNKRGRAPLVCKGALGAPDLEAKSLSGAPLKTEHKSPE